MTNFEAADKLKGIRFAIVDMRDHRDEQIGSKYAGSDDKEYDEYIDALALAINALYAEREG